MNDNRDDEDVELEGQDGADDEAGELEDSDGEGA